MAATITGMRRLAMGAIAPPRKAPKFLRNLWVSRRLVLASVVLGVLLWFIVINNQPATVYFPFALGQSTASIGVIVLLSAIVGSFITGLVMTIIWAWKRYRLAAKAADATAASADPPAIAQGPDFPPAVNAIGTSDSFSGARWSAR
jgi:uncharacterized integral membrane protein